MLMTLIGKICGWKAKHNQWAAEQLQLQHEATLYIELKKV